MLSPLAACLAPVGVPLMLHNDACHGHLIPSQLSVWLWTHLLSQAGLLCTRQKVVEVASVLSFSSSLDLTHVGHQRPCTPGCDTVCLHVETLGQHPSDKAQAGRHG